MKIAIMGAGTLGKSLAAAFCNDKHDVVIIDKNSKTLRRLADKLDVMTVTGNGVEVLVLKNAEINSMDLFISATESDSKNIYACQIAKHLGAKNTISRLTSEKYFDLGSELTPKNLGIDHIVVPIDACVNKIFNVLDTHQTLEKIIFGVKDAIMAAFLVLDGSPLANLKLKEFPDSEIIRSIRLSTILRHGKLISPSGDTEIKVGDEVYISGTVTNVNRMLKWTSPDNKKIKRVVIAGGTQIGTSLAKQLSLSGYDVRLIEENSITAETILDENNIDMIVINGDANDRDVLDEAGTDACDAFVAVQEDDEDNILSCILAKQMGAKKVITLTNKEEYITLVPRMKMIDCGFSKWLVAVNSILRHISAMNRAHTNAILHRADAYVSEFEIQEESELCNKQIDECVFPDSTVLSMVFRNDNVLVPAGDLTLMQGDLVTVIATSKTEKPLGSLFKGTNTKIKL